LLYKLLKQAASILAIATGLTGIQTVPVHAADMTAEIVAIGTGTSTVNYSPKFTVRFTGGPAATSSNCSQLQNRLGESLVIEFQVDGLTTTLNGLETYFSDFEAGPQSLSCVVMTDASLTSFDAATPAKQLQISLSLNSARIASKLGQLRNPDYKGTISITSPFKGETVGQSIHITYSIDPGPGRTPESVGIAICSQSCGKNPSLVDVFPSMDTNANSYAGVVLGGDSAAADLAFSKNGLTEIFVSASFEGVTNSASVLVNVSNNIQASPVAWDLFTKLVKVGATNLWTSLDCGGSAVAPGVAKTCVVSAETPGVVTTIPYVVAYSSNGIAARTLGALTVRSDEKASFNIPVSKTTKSLRVLIFVPNAGFGSDEKSFGPPPPSLSVSFPSIIKSKKVFNIAVKSKASFTGRCSIYLDGGQRIGAFDLKNGQGKGSSSVQIYANAPASLRIPISLHCDYGPLWSWSADFAKSIPATK
jgi:hypothetical protein